MATVSTTNTPTGLRQPFEKTVSGISGQVGAAPIAKIVFAGAFNVAAKGAGDESQVIMTCTLPTGYHYRPSLLWVSAVGTAVDVFEPVTGFESGASQSITEDSIATWLSNLVNVFERDLDVGAIKVLTDATANDFQTLLVPEDAFTRSMVNAAQGSSVYSSTWMDTSDDTTTLITITWRLEVMQFTIEQVQSFLPNAPTLIYS